MPDKTAHYSLLIICINFHFKSLEMPGIIYVIGSSNTDMVIRADQLPRPGETVIGGHFIMNAGGKGANQAVAAARLDGRVCFVANVGDDLFGHEAIAQLRKEKINTDFITVDPRHPSGVALINVDANGENSIAVASGANGHLTPDMLASALPLMQPVDIALVQLEIPLATIEFIAQWCSANSVRLIVNPAPATHLGDALLKKIHLITPNETETEFLTGISVNTPERIKNAAAHLHKKGIAKVVITLGKRGAYWSSEDGNGFVEAPRQDAVDTTAAGDCFNGALAVALADNKSLEEAVRFACIAASLSVTKIGAQVSMPMLRELTSSL